jgi:hypothetical protein
MPSRQSQRLSGRTRRGRPGASSLLHGDEGGGWPPHEAVALDAQRQQAGGSPSMWMEVLGASANRCVPSGSSKGWRVTRCSNSKCMVGDAGQQTGAARAAEFRAGCRRVSASARLSTERTEPGPSETSAGPDCGSAAFRLLSLLLLPLLAPPAATSRRAETSRQGLLPTQARVLDAARGPHYKSGATFACATWARCHSRGGAPARRCSSRTIRAEAMPRWDFFVHVVDPAPGR